MRDFAGPSLARKADDRKKNFRPPAEVWRGGSRRELAILVAALVVGAAVVGRQQHDAAVYG